MSEVVGNAAKQSCSEASFSENHIDPEYGLPDKLKISDLPFEIFDLILKRAVLLQMCFGDKIKRPTDQCIFMNLASVNGLWSEFIKRRKFKKTVLRLLTVYFLKAKKRSIIIDHNYEFLKDVLQPDSLIDQLDITGCLTENEIEKLKRIRKGKDKNDELLFLLRNFNSQNYSLFVQCLCSTGQNSVARVLEHGGETVKVHIANRDIFQTTNRKISLDTKFMQVPKLHVYSYEFWDYIDLPFELRLNDVYVLHTNQDQDHGITIWLWFKNEDAWNEMKANSKDVLLEIIQELFQCLMPKLNIQPQNVQLQHINLKYGFVKRSLVVRPKAKLQIKGGAEHVVVLKDKIYVTQKRSILVYKNKAPYLQLREIRLPKAILGLHTPLQIAVCRMHNCLYTADSDTRCIYKIEPMHDRLLTSWLNEAGSLIVATTHSGDVLVLRREAETNRIERKNILRIFNNDGVLMHDMSVPHVFNEEVKIIQEIAPNVIAMICLGVRPSYCKFVIFTMNLGLNIPNLNRLELTDLRDSFGVSINCLVPFSSCQLLIGVGHDDDDDDEKRYRVGLYDYYFRCNQIENIRYDKTIPVDIYFSAGQKELFVLTAEKPLYFPEVRQQSVDCIKWVDNMSKQSQWLPNAYELESLYDKFKLVTAMKRRFADMYTNFEIEIYKLNYEDDDYD